MSDCPRTDSEIFPILNPALEYVNAAFARQLERENAAQAKEIATLRDLLDEGKGQSAASLLFEVNQKLLKSHQEQAKEIAELKAINAELDDLPQISVTALIKERDRLKAKLATLKEQYEFLQRQQVVVQAENDRLQKERDADKARLDWLETEMVREGIAVRDGTEMPRSLFRKHFPITRAAIDAARKEQS